MPDSHTLSEEIVDYDLHSQLAFLQVPVDAADTGEFVRSSLYVLKFRPWLSF